MYYHFQLAKITLEKALPEHGYRVGDSCFLVLLTICTAKICRSGDFFAQKRDSAIFVYKCLIV